MEDDADFYDSHDEISSALWKLERRGLSRHSKNVERVLSLKKYYGHATVELQKGYMCRMRRGQV